MKFYLKWINPAVALTILFICTWIWLTSYFYSDSGVSAFEKGKNILLFNGITFYFFAKGLFCSSLLFMFGEFLKKYLDKNK